MTEILKDAKPPPSNLTKNERDAIQSLKKNNDIVILPADKGKCTVVMDKEEYIQKMETKLSDIDTYKKLEKDLTDDLQKEIAKQLDNIEAAGQINKVTHLKLRPTQSQIPRIHGHPKIHKPPEYPLREIVDSTGSVVKQIDKYVSRILKQYVKKTDHYVKNSSDFVEQVKHETVGEHETLVSYDVTALYPSVPLDEAMSIFHDELLKDEQIMSKTSISPGNIIKLFRTCVETTYFVFNGNLYQQVNGLAIGASTSGFAAELFMQRLESKALHTFATPPRSGNAMLMTPLQDYEPKM